MAQLRRYPNVLPPHLGSHNMNGNSERVEQREKAKIARVQTSDMEVNKKSTGHLFPPPIKVNDSSDEFAKTIKKSLGDYNNFVKIMNQEVSREKAPGQTCIGVMPAPVTPTENKTHLFPSSLNKTKTKDKPSNSTQERPKGVSGIEKLDLKAKLDQKHKTSSDASRHKPLKLGEKLNDKKDNKDTKKISLDKYKNNQTSVAEKSTTLPTGKQKSNVKDDATTHNKVQELNKEVEKIVKKEETGETSQTETTKKNEHSNPKAKPTPLQLPSRNASSSCQLQSPQHRDMKLQNILKEMTESVNMPLTGIYTPLPKQDSRFPFPSNVDEKENSQVSSDPTNSFMKDFDLSDDEDSDDERENDDDLRPAGQTRSRSSSSSSSSSSGESSDSEGEEVEDDKTKVNVVSRTSMLNSPPVSAIKTPSPPAQPATTIPQPVKTLPQPQTSSKSAGDETLGKPRTSSKSDESISNIKLETKSIKEEPKGASDKVEEQLREKKSSDKVDASLLSAGQKHTLPVNKPKAEHREKLPDTKIRIKVEKGSNDSFRVKTDSKVKADTKKRTETESKQVSGEVKSIAEKGKTAEQGSESRSKTSSKLGVKIKKPVNGLVKVKNSSQSKEAEKKEKKLDTAVEKRKRKDSTGDSTGKQVKDKSDLHSSKEKKNVSKDKAELQSAKNKTEELSSKDTNRTKSSNKEKKMSDRRESFGFDSPDLEEESVIIDVVGDDSPATKKKKTDSTGKKNGVNGVHKNGHVDMPLDIQLVHDKDKDPTSLIVKIPLSFLKRIPSKFAENLSVENSHADVELGSLENDEKKPEHWSQKKNGKNGNMLVELNDEMKSSKHLNNHGKRSPSWENNHLPSKRVRRDSQQLDQKKRKTTAELNAECEADIKKDEPDTHLRHAKTLKREADKLTDKEAKSRTYVEAIVRFICCGKALEDKDDGENRAAQMYSETNELLRFILKHVLGKTEDKRLLILCLRVQSLLLYKLYRMKGRQTVRNSQILAEHFKATHKNNITSPYTSSAVSNKHGSTPSPLSPTPSPAGSIGSIGSNGSNSSNEGNHTQNGRQASTASVTSPVSISIPQRIHSVMAQHVSSTSKLVNSIDMWDRADSLSSDYQEFFSTVDSICGALTFHSSIPHVVNYVKNSLSNFHEHGKRT